MSRQIEAKVVKVKVISDFGTMVAMILRNPFESVQFEGENDKSVFNFIKQPIKTKIVTTREQ